MSLNIIVNSVFVDPVESVLCKYIEKESGEAREEFKEMLDLYREKLISIKIIEGRILISPFSLD